MNLLKDRVSITSWDSTTCQSKVSNYTKFPFPFVCFTFVSFQNWTSPFEKTYCAPVISYDTTPNSQISLYMQVVYVAGIYSNVPYCSLPGAHYTRPRDLFFVEILTTATKTTTSPSHVYDIVIG